MGRADVVAEGVGALGRTLDDSLVPGIVLAVGRLEPAALGRCADGCGALGTATAEPDACGLGAGAVEPALAGGALLAEEVGCDRFDGLAVSLGDEVALCDVGWPDVAGSVASDVGVGESVEVVGVGSGAGVGVGVGSVGDGVGVGVGVGVFVGSGSAGQQSNQRPFASTQMQQ